MKQVIAARRERGGKVGHFAGGLPRSFPTGCQEASAVVREARSDARARDLAPLVWKAIADGKSMSVIADEFNESGVAPPQRRPWTKNSIWRIARRTASVFGQRPPGGKRIGTAQNKVRKRVDDIGPLLLGWRLEGKTYRDIAAEFGRCGVESPWGRGWGPASIRRYLMRALDVSALRLEDEKASRP